MAFVAYDVWSTPGQAAPPVPPAPAPARSRRWLAAVAAVWALVVVGFGYASAGRDEATAREQTSVADARPAVDRAVSGLVAAAGPGAVVAVSPFTRIGACRISAVRDGERWEQAIVYYTQAGGEAALLDRLAAGLPAEFGARARHRADGRHTLRADAGDFVSVSGGVAASGEVRLAVNTGCRTGTAQVAAAEPDPAVRAPVAAAFAALRLPAASWRMYEVPCDNGGVVRVVRADSDAGVRPGPLPSGLMSVAPGPVVAQPDLYAYRTGPASVVAQMRDDVLVVTATTPCS